MSRLLVSNRNNYSKKIQLHRTVELIRTIRQQLLLGLSDEHHPSTLPPTIGFVPTMGALHEGHLSLVREARVQNDIVIASIFVNPTQFAPTDDLSKYPRQLEIDLKLLEKEGVDHVFAPSDPSMLYGPDHTTFVEVEGFDNTAEGKTRPGHFRGVATIVTKLFNIVQPTNAYFGQKDAAQCVLIKRIVEDLNMNVQIHIQDTIREKDGLAMSSRNTYLTPTERHAACVLYKSLYAAKQQYDASCLCIPSRTLQQIVRDVLFSEPMVSEIQYIAIDDPKTMQPLVDNVDKGRGAIISIAVKIGNVRLIDNIILPSATT